ncbi:signal transduction histidine kinase [Actinoplanes octamycinicus]|uniref:Oxygen sensor histidine kinase NreB n=1 Tax=Actinoplanes octamycinicus TaxID=135948 RepID=A0A7W7H7R7_9ACTN|nr:sensor histidine kinase [Actinoplanes octamycinicus]MBB4745581.1 signal transduction histidine kinase [Actinoplanes octamycinicus]GIE56424.1 histidine kinase [Actinoplanes octamycinicus]
MDGGIGVAVRTDWTERRLLAVAGGLLAASTLLAVLGRPMDLPMQPLPTTFAVAAATAALLLVWRVTPRSEDRNRAVSILFFLVFLSLSALLVWCHPLYGFFVWTGYLFTVYTLPGWWRLLGAASVAFVTAASQSGGFRTLGTGGGIVLFGFLFLCNAGISIAMTRMESQKELKAIRRNEIIDELAEANAKLETALQENAGLHAQLLAQAREAGVLDERQRMAGEIHDVLAQGLTGIVTQLEAAEAHPGERDRHLAAAKRLARESLAEARRSVQALRPQHLDDAGLPDALGEVVETWSGMHGVRADLITTGTARRLLPEIETTLLRTAQEALANVARHANAARVGLTLSYMEDMVTLDVRDDGAGFDPDQPREVTDSGGFGLSAMRERLARIAGSLAVESEPGGGTALSACVPAITMGGAA